MNPLRRRFLSASAGLALVTAVMAGASTAWAEPAPTAGEITKLDVPGKRVTIRHAEIKNLDMPAMTMVFRVRDAQLLQGMAVGDAVSFVAEKIDGQYTVTALRKGK